MTEDNVIETAINRPLARGGEGLGERQCPKILLGLRLLGDLCFWAVHFTSAPHLPSSLHLGGTG